MGFGISAYIICAIELGGYLQTQKGARTMKLLRATRINFLRWANDPKYLAVLVYMVLYMWHVIGGVVEYARELNVPIHPSIF